MFVVTARNPIERMISWFLFKNLSKIHHPNYDCDGKLYQKCYQSVDDFATRGLSASNSKELGSCQKLARNLIIGEIHRNKDKHPHCIHIARNSKIYLYELLEKHDENHFCDMKRAWHTRFEYHDGCHVRKRR